MAAPEQQRTFLVECYAPGIERPEVEAAGRRAATAAASLRAEGRTIEYVRALFVPSDEAVFHVFAADDAVAVREAGSRADLVFERVVESISITPPPATLGAAGRRQPP